MNKFITLLRESGLARFLIPAGLIMAIFGAVFFRISQQNQDYLETQATVRQVTLEQEASTDADGNRTEATYSVVVQYTVDGKPYEAELVGVSKMEVGETMKIYYDPENPANVTQTKSLVIPLIITGVGLVMLVGGIVSLIHALKRIRKMEEQEKEWSNGN